MAKVAISLKTHVDGEGTTTRRAGMPYEIVGHLRAKRFKYIGDNGIVRSSEKKAFWKFVEVK